VTGAAPRLAGWAAAAVALGAIPYFLSSYQLDVYRLLLLWIALALGYNFLFGVAGQIAFSHFAFYGVGAYSVVILWSKLGVPLPLAVAGAIAICALLAFVVAVPATRLEGFYLALATLAFGQLFIVLITEGGDFTGAAAGIQRYARPPIFGYSLTAADYALVIVALLLGTFAILRALDRSWFGRACRAVRDNSASAAAMGVDVARVKIAAFTITSTLAGAAGVVYAFLGNGIAPTTFDVNFCFQLLFMIIVGGLGRPLGAILGTILLYLAPFVLEPFVGHHHPLIYGFLMLGVILFQRDGLMGILDAIARLLRRGRAREQAA
jgi:branched-chain amino acid transport system permease protein